MLRKHMTVAGWTLVIVLLRISVPVWAADSSADSFAKKVYEITKASDFIAYGQLVDPRCHPGPAMADSFKLRSDLANKLTGVKVEAMPLAAYDAMMKKKGAPPDLVIYRVKPSHIVIAHGTIPGMAGGDRVELNPVLPSDTGWKILEGDCLSNGPSVTRQKPK